MISILTKQNSKHKSEKASLQRRLDDKEVESEKRRVELARRTRNLEARETASRVMKWTVQGIVHEVGDSLLGAKSLGVMSSVLKGNVSSSKQEQQ